MSDVDSGSAASIESVRTRWKRAERADRIVYAVLAVAAVALVGGMLIGTFSVMYIAGLLILAATYGLLSIGLNVQWGYAGLINFSVVAFMGIGAYAAMLVSSPLSPLELGWHPAVAIPFAIVAAGIVAVAIGVPTLRLREDYLAIATLGLAEVVRLVILNERQWTAGSRGISGMPVPMEWLPIGQRWVVLLLAALLLVAVYLFARRVHRSPWGRAQRTIRADEDLAQALGKNTFRLKMEAFVIGSVVMSLAGVLYVLHNQFLSPSALLPIETFYVWVALILGGTGSERGALLGGVIIVAIRQGTRFVSDTAAYDAFTELVEGYGVLPYLDASSLRLFLVGVLIVAVIRFRPEGLLPPRQELIWPGTDAGGAGGDRRAHREADADATARSAGPAGNATGGGDEA